VVQQQIPYKKGRKDTAHSVLTPENFNLVLHAVINPEIAHHGGGWSESKQPLIETSVVPVSEPPAETVTVQPDGGIQHGRKLKKNVYAIDGGMNMMGCDIDYVDFFFSITNSPWRPSGCTTTRTDR
jgi:hypothetical protein